MFGLSAFQRGEPAAAELHPEPAHHAAGKHITYRAAGGESESAAEPGTHTNQVQSHNIYNFNPTSD